MNINNDSLNTALSTAIKQSVIKMEGKPDKVRKFDETVDLIINIRDVDLKNPNNRIDQELLLPYPIKGNKPKNKICFIVKDEMEISLKEKGYYVINSAMLDSLQKQPKKDKKTIAKKYDYFIASADLMRNLAKVLARFLGQQGKMPRPQPKGFGVIRPNENIDAYIDKLSRIIKISMKKSLLMQLKVGKKSQDVEEVLKNIDTILHFLQNSLPNGYNNIKSMFIKTTMGNSVRVMEPRKRRK